MIIKNYKIYVVSFLQLKIILRHYLQCDYLESGIFNVPEK